MKGSSELFTECRRTIGGRECPPSSENTSQDVPIAKRPMLRGLRNQISSTAHSGVVRGHVELFRHLVLSLVVTRSQQDLSHTRSSKERLDYWQVRRRTS